MELNFANTISSGLWEARRKSLIYISRIRGAGPLTVEDLPFCREVVGIPKPPPYGYAKNLMGILGKWPLPILNYTSPLMSAALDKLLGARDFNIVHPRQHSPAVLVRSLAARERQGSLKAIYNWHNIESEAMRRYSLATTSGSRSWYAGHTAKKLENLETDILHTAFGHLVCSERERDQLHRIAPEARIAVIENGVDTGYFAGSGGGATSRRQIIFVGAMDYFPNSEAAILFANRIWPAVRNKLGDAELLIVGANPGPAVRALGELSGVQVTGMVPDVRPYYEHALAAVVPLFTGGGTRLKILEAMAAGCSRGFDSARCRRPRGGGRGERTARRAGRCTGLGQPARESGCVSALRVELIGAGLRLVETRYDWEILGAKLRKTYEDWLGSADAATAR